MNKSFTEDAIAFFIRATDQDRIANHLPTREEIENLYLRFLTDDKWRAWFLNYEKEREERKAAIYTVERAMHRVLFPNEAP